MTGIRPIPPETLALLEQAEDVDTLVRLLRSQDPRASLEWFVRNAGGPRRASLEQALARSKNDLPLAMVLLEETLRIFREEHERLVEAEGRAAAGQKTDDSMRETRPLATAEGRALVQELCARGIVRLDDEPVLETKSQLARALEAQAHRTDSALAPAAVVASFEDFDPAEAYDWLVIELLRLAGVELTDEDVDFQLGDEGAQLEFEVEGKAYRVDVPEMSPEFAPEFFEAMAGILEKITGRILCDVARSEEVHAFVLLPPELAKVWEGLGLGSLR